MVIDDFCFSVNHYTQGDSPPSPPLSSTIIPSGSNIVPLAAHDALQSAYAGPPPSPHLEVRELELVNVDEGLSALATTSPAIIFWLA